MKLLKKIAPIAVGAVLGLATMGGAIAADLGTWKNNFPAANTVVVAYDSDAAAIAEIANYLGLRGGTTITGESWEFKKSTDKLNLGENLSRIRSTISKEQLPTILAEGTYWDEENNEHKYTQKITVGNLTLTHFQDYDYKDNEPTLGFKITDTSFILNYTLTFSGSGPEIEDMNGTSIEMLGREFFISKAEAGRITLLETSTRATIEEGSTVTVGGKTIGISYFTSGGERVSLIVDGEETNPIAEGRTYKLRDGTVVGVKTIIYDTRQGYKSKVIVTVGTGKIELINDTEVKINDKTVYGLKSYIDAPSDNLKSITLEWTADDDYYIGSGDELLMPGLKALKLMMTEMVFPSGEDITIKGDGRKAKLEVPIKDGKASVVLLEGNGTNWTTIGEEGRELKTTLGTTLNNLERGNRFFTTYINGEEGESYYWEVESFDNERVTFKALVGSASCTVAEGGDCEVGEVSFTVTALDADSKLVNISAGNNVTFHTIVSSKGARFYLPQTEDEGGPAYINISNNTGKWNLTMTEEDEDGNIGSGKNITFKFGFTDDGKATVADVYSAWAGGDMLKKGEDTWIGYVESPLATKVVYETGGKQDYATVTYFGEEVYGNVFIAGAGAAAGGGEVAITYPELTESMKATKNIISIGGSGVNPFSAELLFGSPTLVYGSDSRWVSATGVDGVGKALVQLYQGTSACQKVCLLVAGFEASDTLKAAKFLTTKADELTGKTKAVLDTTGSEASVITT